MGRRLDFHHSTTRPPADSSRTEEALDVQCDFQTASGVCVTAGAGCAWRRWHRRRATGTNGTTAAGRPKRRTAGRPDRIDRRAGDWIPEARWLLPRLLGRGRRQAVDGDPQTQYRSALLDRLRVRAGIQRHRDRPRSARRLTHHLVRARRSARARRAAQLPLPRDHGQRRRGSGGTRRIRALGHLELSRRRRLEWAGARRRDRLPRPRQCRRRIAADTRRVPVRAHSQLHLHAHDAELPEEHRDGGRADVRPSGRRRRRPRWPRRRCLRRGRRRRCHAGGRQHPAPSLDRRASRRQLQAASLRPTLRLRRHVVRELLGAPRHPDDTALHPSSPARKEGPVGGDQRPREANRLLPRPGRARADPFGAARGCALVEPGVRGGGLPKRLPGRAAARGRQPARHPLQRHQLGASLHARLEHGWQRRRSPDG